MNKEIIIAGVDVNGCEHLTEIQGCCLSTCDYLKYKGNITNKLCKYNPNCYYKQLARAEQENKRLLEIINAKPLETVDIDSAFEIEKLKEQLKAKEQECEELKKCLLQVQNASISLNKQLDKLKQTLIEIKAICNNNDELQGNFNVVDCDKYKLGKHNLANKVLQKISECEGKNEN